MRYLPLACLVLLVLVLIYISNGEKYRVFYIVEVDFPYPPPHSTVKRYGEFDSVVDAKAWGERVVDPSKFKWTVETLLFPPEVIEKGLK